MARAAEVSSKPKLITYRYVALAPDGKRIRGTVKATGEIAAERLIVNDGNNPINVEVAPSMFSLEEAIPSLFHVKSRDVIVFSRQLATLLKSGIPLLSALETLQDQVATSTAFRRVISDIVNDIRAGGSFPLSISKHPRVFSDIYSKTITVGEGTGNLESVLTQMADYMEKQTALTRKIGRALAYPTAVLIVGIIVAFTLTSVVMPSLIGMFEAMNVELPLPTKILIALSKVIINYKAYLVVGGALLAAGFLALVKQPAGKRFLDGLRLRLPLLGTPVLLSELARFCRSVAVLVKAGMSLQDIMEMVPSTTSNTVVRDALHKVKEGLLMGEGMAEPMRSLSIFPPLLVQMVAVGEESNTIDYTMGVVADFYETTAEEKMSAAVGMIGPISTIVIALATGFLAMSILMPIYALTGSFG